MAKSVQLLIEMILVLTFVSLLNANSIPTDVTSFVIAPIIEPPAVNKHRGCFGDADCNGHGRCLNETECKCDRGWTTHGNAAEADKYCTYKERTKKTAFFLSLFTGAFGVDWFYLSRANLGYIIAGLLKLLLSCGCCGAWPLTYFGPETQNSESAKAKLRGISTCFSLLAFTWWIVDWARILGNKFLDGSGAGLTPW